MGKLRKMLAGVLSAAMVLSTMTVTAFAQTTPATIDTRLKGSITIHKYEYNGKDGEAATGEENASQVPTDAKALEGAGFTLYKVADIDDLTQYYSTNPTTFPKVDDYLTEGKINQSKVKATVTEQKTDKDGITKFTDLELGFYVVVETTTPDKVTSPVKPFLVSVPMTTKDGDNWLYDIHVYPKNATTYGEVKLVKEGRTGSGDETPLAGVTFVLQKYNAEANKWVNVTASEQTGDTFTLVTDKNGEISVSGLSQGKYRFIETSIGKDNSAYIMDGATTYEFEVTDKGEIKYNGNTQAAIEIKVVNEKPDMTKQVQDRTSSKWQQDSDYNVGDKVPYKITVDVPKNITKLKEFKLTDTPKNLKDDVSTVKVKDGENDLPEDTYSVTATTDGGFVITFNPAEMGDYAGKQLTVTYEAELLDSAKTTTEGNPNTAKLEYSNKILPDTDDGSNPNQPGEPGTDTIKDTAIVYTFKLNIEKRANSAEGEKLAGVTFDLYKEVAAGTEGAVSADEVKAAGLDPNKTWIKVAENLTTGGDGTIEKSGLANGTYYLVETKTVEGYNLLKAPVEVKLNIAYKTTTKTEYVIDEEGNKTIVKHEIEKTEFKENEATSTGIHNEVIINKKGFQLPTTGGMGTALFSIAGFALMAGAAVVLLKGRRKDD